MNDLLRINRRVDVTKLNYRPTGLVMGKADVGKSTLVNKLCGSTHATGSDRSGVTQNLFKNTTNCGAYSFQLLDTPGTDSNIDTYKHAYLLEMPY